MNKSILNYLKHAIDLIVIGCSLAMFIMLVTLVFFKDNGVYHAYSTTFSNSWFVILMNFLSFTSGLHYLKKQNRAALGFYLFILSGYMVSVLADWCFLKTYFNGVYFVYATLFVLVVLLHEKINMKFYVFSFLKWAAVIGLIRMNNGTSLLF